MKPNDLNKKSAAMESVDAMESSISDLQTELHVANKPARTHFKPGGLLLAVLVAIVVGVSTFIVATRLATVEDTTNTIKQGCILRNEQINIVNAKFSQLVVLLDASLKNRPPGQPPPDEEILRLFAEFRDPIEPLDCDEAAVAWQDRHSKGLN